MSLLSLLVKGIKLIWNSICNLSKKKIPKKDLAVVVKIQVPLVDKNRPESPPPRLYLPTLPPAPVYPQEVADLYDSPLFKDFIRREERKIWSMRKEMQGGPSSGSALKLRC